MSFEIRWSPRASHDLIRIVEYLDSRDPSWTDSATAAIHRKVDALAQSPFLSSIFETTSRGQMREALAGNYRIFFTVNEVDQIVWLEHIRHVRQQDPDFSE